MKKKRSYVVMNFDTGEFYWADSCTSPKEAMEEYVQETKVEKSFEGQVVESNGFVDFVVTIQPPYKIEQVA